MSGPRYRPPQRVFEALCRHYTRMEIADICGVTPSAVSLWQRDYGCEPVREDPRAKARVRRPKPPDAKLLQKALARALQQTFVD